MTVWQLPRVTFGELNSVKEDRPVALITTPADWAVVRRSLALPLIVQSEPTSNDEAFADSLVASLPSAVEVMYAVGDGIALDVAKLVASKANKPLVIVPTRISSDKPFTAESEVGRNPDAKIIQGAMADRVLIDIELIRSAPVYARATGIVDVLSIVTALMDWGYAAQKGKLTAETQFVPWVAGVSAGLASQALKSAPAIGKGDPEAMKLLIGLLMLAVQIDVQSGHRRATQGTEHIFAQAINPVASTAELTHAEKVGPGILLASALHKKDSGGLRTALEAAGVRLMQLKGEDIRNTWNNLPDYARQRNTPYSILNETQVGSEDLAQAITKSTLILS